LQIRRLYTTIIPYGQCNCIIKGQPKDFLLPPFMDFGVNSFGGINPRAAGKKGKS
jgi:hypothetical protein